MKKINFLIIFAVIFILGCSQDNLPIEEDKTITTEKESITAQSKQDIISECDSLCNSKSEDYCRKERTIVVNGEEITGTCRSFSKKGNVEGFNRCKGFCKEYGKI